MSLIVQDEILALSDVEEERLAHQAPRLDALTAEECDRIARVAYRISQVEAMRDRRVLPTGMALKPWQEFSARERAEARATVMRVVQSLVLLGWVEPPEG